MKCDSKNKKKYSKILKILLENEFGSLLRIINIFSKQKNIIKNMKVILKNKKKIFDITIEIMEKKKEIKKIKKKLYTLINVIKIYEINDINHFIRETILIHTEINQIFSKRIKYLLEIFQVKIIYFKKFEYIIEISEHYKKIKKFLKKLKKIGKIIHISRSGKNVIPKN
ncbi:acetolactate synthase small subunit [Buchnera aphidicola]|uniref:acetolactate synthase small subunit n=1 Tax=Buchnera aphidicola TaxID=9 RepID=UPI002092AD41|nr:acetolactate synthase small subunit [Buchnera aphidicola]USS94278.1 acetolactate synthase small subunit [Buchnera aphidicola (Sipha maydis)]